MSDHLCINTIGYSPFIVHLAVPKWIQQNISNFHLNDLFTLRGGVDVESENIKFILIVQNKLLN
jgi:hypothetical protein